jgi:hypothetical protein
MQRIARAMASGHMRVRRTLLSATHGNRGPDHYLGMASERRQVSAALGVALHDLDAIARRAGASGRSRRLTAPARPAKLAVKIETAEETPSCENSSPCSPP